MRTKRHIIATLIGLLLIQVVSGQESKLNIDSEYFLLGTLTDYLGRLDHPKFQERVDYYYKYEKAVSDEIYAIFNSQFELKYEITKDSNRYEIYSGQLSSLIDNYYNFKPSGSMTMQHDTIYRGILRSDIFDTELKKLSFLAGVFARFGEVSDTTYSIKIANSMSKVKICETLLKELDCSEVNYEILRDYIPSGHNLYFKPSEKVDEYLTEYYYLRKQIKLEADRLFEAIMNEADNN